MVGLCTTSYVLDWYIRKQDDAHLSAIQMVWLISIQMAFKYRTIWHPTSFQQFKYRTSFLFRIFLDFCNLRRLFLESLADKILRDTIFRKGCETNDRRFFETKSNRRC